MTINRVASSFLRGLLCFLFFLFGSIRVMAQVPQKVQISPVGLGWAKNSVNAVIFRKNAIVSFNGMQYIAYYNEDGKVVLGKRKLGTDSWELKVTQYSGNVYDAHNTISIMVDDDGYLHLAWDHHNGILNYCKSKTAYSLNMGDKQTMTGLQESRVTYPEFFKLPNGNLLFFYRNGESGKGNLIINKYDKNNKKWTTLHDNLINGEGQRNAYVQSAVDKSGTIHVSWVWRESADVATNHDMCYARSKDGGITWEKSDGTIYTLPITAQNAEYAARIPQQSELINQTSMTTDDSGNPVIATYWKGATDRVPQYHLIYLHDGDWITQTLPFRKTDFSLGGVGTKRIPISRPQVLAKGQGKHLKIYVVFRDEERENRVSIAYVSAAKSGDTRVIDLFQENVGSWEPSFDTELWKHKHILHLYLQHVEQADGEGKTAFPPQMVKVLQWKL